MEPDRWSRIKEILNAALDGAPAERERVLDEQCAGDDELRREVASLLAAHDEAASNDEFFGAADQPERVGPYRILRAIAKGGMGVVYLAEQLEPIRRQVAVKLIKVGMDTRDVVARFDLERQALALMSHPYIAQVFDAGSTEEGRPYFAMEYVPGVPITEYCDANNRSIPQRLELFLKVCDAIQHAHQKGVVHRDIKPSNVLVMRRDGDVIPKIIDFGIAKATGISLARQTLYTRTGLVIGTPEYVSPEQATPTEGGVDTRTDVYSLGVLLYELLTGLLPFGRSTDPGTSPDEILRRVRTEEPVRPSARLAALPPVAAATAMRARAVDVRRLVRMLRRDIDWIVLRAMDRDPARRYASASELAADLHRYLSDQPLIAGPPSASYRAAKFIRRHRLAVLVATFAVVLLASVAIVVTGLAIRMARERDRAARESETSRQVSQFLTDVFKVADPSEARGNAVKAREILDRGTERIRKDLADQPLVQGRLLLTMGDTYTNLGLAKEAAALYEAGVQALRATLGAHDAETLHAVDRLAFNYSSQGRLADAETMASAALEQARLAFGENSPPTIEALKTLAAIYTDQSRFPESEKLIRQAASAQASLSGPDDPKALVLRHNLAKALLDQGRFAEAEPIYEEVLETRRRVLGRDDPLTLSTAINLAVVYKKERRFDAAELLYKESLEIGRRVLGADHPRVMEITNNLGTLYLDQGRLREAETWLEETLSNRLRKLGPENPRTLRTRTNLASTLVGDGRAAEAEPLLRQNLEIQRRILGGDHEDTLVCLSILGQALLQQRRFREAESCAREAFDSEHRTLGATHPETLESAILLGDVLSSEGRHDEAIRLARETYDSASRVRGATDAISLDALIALAKVQARAGHRDDAVTSLRKAQEDGYEYTKKTLDGPDFVLLRPDARFQQLVALAQRRATQESGNNPAGIQGK